MLLAAAFLLHAGTSAAEVPQTTIRISVGALAIQDDLGELHLAGGTPGDGRKSEWRTVALNELTVGESIDYRGPATLGFYAAPVAGSRQVATVDLPTSATSVLLVFIPEAATGGYRVLPIPDSEFGFGSYYFHNLSQHAVAIDLAGRKRILNPGDKAVERAAPGEDQEVKIHASINGTPRLIKATSWRLDAGQRELVFFHTPPGSNLVRTKHLISSQSIATAED
jgi:hypothetical protein